VQTIQGVRQVRLNNRTDSEIRHVNKDMEKLRRIGMRATRYKALTLPITDTLTGLAMMGSILLGGFMLSNDMITVGTLTAFLAAVSSAYQPVKRLGSFNNGLQAGLAAAQRVFAVIDTQPNVVAPDDAPPLRITEGRITLDNVGMRYSSGDTPALKNINMEVPAGGLTALVGPSGAGKSTVFNLLPRLYDPTAGRIFIDGQDTRAVSLESLRDSIAVVSQEIMLFTDTIKKNIAYGATRRVRDDEIVQAARQAAAHGFIMDLPEGYETMVGEQGLRLSGGQRQRIAIARAILRDAPILLLDEATSALDTESERQIQGALDQLMAGRTTLAIAHRLSTIHHAPRIYVMDKGEVVEVGTHEELLERGGLYARLHAMQTRKDDSEPEAA
jgi:subfamily B ATP-binding cassette protein MsbA